VYKFRVLQQKSILEQSLNVKEQTDRIHNWK